MPTDLCADCVRKIGAMGDYKARADEKPVMESGRKLAAGDGSFDDLEKIVLWKSRRIGKRIKVQRNRDIFDEVFCEVRAADTAGQISALTRFHGVRIPAASAILTAMFPDRYTMIDVRALDALGVRDAKLSTQFFIDYLEFCHSEARRLGVSLRTLDRVLWKVGYVG